MERPDDSQLEQPDTPLSSPDASQSSPDTNTAPYPYSTDPLGRVDYLPGASSPSPEPASQAEEVTPNPNIRRPGFLSRHQIDQILDAQLGVSPDAGTTQRRSPSRLTRAVEVPLDDEKGRPTKMDAAEEAARKHPKHHRDITRPEAFPSVEEVGERLQSGTLEEAGFHEIELDEIDPIFLGPMDVITGIKTLHDFNHIEQEIVGSISPAGNMGSAAALAREHFAGDRIENHLRPSKFVGRLLGGQAIVLPFSKKTALQLGTKARQALQKHDDERDPPIEGLTVIYSGILQRSVGKVGVLDVVAAYQVRFGQVQYTLGNFGYINRTVSRAHTREMERLMAVQDRQSIARAYNLTAFAMQHPILGGLPGGGKTSSKYGGHK